MSHLAHVVAELEAGREVRLSDVDARALWDELIEQ